MRERKKEIMRERGERERERRRERGNVQLYSIVNLEIWHLRDTFVGVFEM